jgi:hypothetical protein
VIGDDLTEAQRAFVEGPADTFVQACPGAGKTRAIVRRYLRRIAEEPRKGIALVSFTKVAIDEVRKRCGATLDALEPPNFVGTFDAFINRYFTTPLYARAYGRALTYVESWEALSAGWIGRGHYTDQVSLEWFDFDQDGNATFVPERVDGKYRAGLIREIQDNLQAYCNRAAMRRRTLIVERGVASASASRWFARKHICEHPTRTLLANHLAARFAEVIVDEAQDCGADELAILEFLREAGVFTTLVADLDQAIYEFRRATPRQLEVFVQSLTRGQTLDGNFRSSPAICALNCSLRSSAYMENAVGRHAAVATPVQLVSYDKLSELPIKLSAVVAANGLRNQDMVVLAHAASHALQAAGAGKTSDVGNRRIVLIANAAQRVLSQSSDARVRVGAIQDVERILVGLIDDEQPGYATLDALCEVYGLDRRWLRDAATRVLMAAHPADHDSSTYTARIRAVVSSIAFPPHLKLRRVNQYLATPPAVAWRALEKPQQRPWFTWGTIHSVKGQEFPGVALIIPEGLRKDDKGRTVIDHWRDSLNSEARRVLYVGASRAQRLLVLAVHSKHSGQVVSILGRDAVPFEIFR